jgi:hypothetical protein
MNKDWIVTYYNISTWNFECASFEDEGEAREFVEERLDKQSQDDYLKGKVLLFPPNSSVTI